MRLLYFLNKATKNITRNFSLHFFAILTISFSLIIFYLFLFLKHNLDQVLSHSQNNEIVVYLETEINPDDLPRYRKEITEKISIESMTFSPPDQSFKQFQKNLRENAYLLEGLPKNFLPAYFKIKLTPPVNNLDQITKELKDLYFVSGVDYGRKIYHRLNQIESMITHLWLYLLLFIIVAIGLPIYSTIRQTIYSRRDEIDILQLVGGTRGFIRTPFYMEGIFQGISSALLSLGVFYLLFSLFNTQFESDLLSLIGMNTLSFLTSFHIILTLIFTGLIGFFASLISVNKFLKI